MLYKFIKTMVFDSKDVDISVNGMINEWKKIKSGVEIVSVCMCVHYACLDNIPEKYDKKCITVLVNE